MYSYLDFEKPISDLEAKIIELKKIVSEDDGIDTTEEISRLEGRVNEAMTDIYEKLTPWQKAQVARHPQRPHFVNYAARLFTDVTTLAGDRNFGEDAAIQAGLARFRGRPVAFIGEEKGHDTKSRLKHNFGMPRPEGYRKAIRVMELADRFNLPVISIVDTPGAYPGVGAEERGQAEAIARSTQMCLRIGVPLITLVIGEGMSGGAIAIAAASRVYMLEHSIYSVISPEGAASILWRDSARAKEAATNMKITAQDLRAFGVVDEIIPEPVGGAHRNADIVIDASGDQIAEGLSSFDGMSAQQIRDERRQKFLAIGRNL